MTVLHVRICYRDFGVLKTLNPEALFWNTLEGVPGGVPGGGFRGSKKGTFLCHFGVFLVVFEGSWRGPRGVWGLEHLASRGVGPGEPEGGPPKPLKFGSSFEDLGSDFG